MANKAKFAMAFHCYQPVFNLRPEIERAYNNAYLPLLNIFREFPGVKASFHFSGNMLEWLEKERPEYINLLKELVRREQIELIGGGYFEPVMTIIPERDRRDQLRMNQDIILRMFGVKTKGLWLAERVWDPSLMNMIRHSDAVYTILDDNHIIGAGVDKDDVYKPFKVVDGRRPMTFFPSNMSLRYSMPFSLTGAVVEYMKGVYNGKKEEEHVCFFFADDGEKFGLWPHTYNWVHRKGWLREFFGLLEKNSSWLDIMTYSDIMDSVPAGKISNIPASSYQELMEWSGGDFSNFFTRYHEAGRMHKRMLKVSDIVDFASRTDSSAGFSEEIREAKKELFKSQTGCAYWHGTFGGFYLPHLRSGVYHHLIKAENIVDSLLGKKSGDRGVGIVESGKENDPEEVKLSNVYINVFVSPSDGGSVCEIDHKPGNTNITNTITRVREKYHDKLNSGSLSKFRQIRNFIVDRDSLDIHELLGIGEKGLKSVLQYDDYRKNSFLTHIFTDNVLAPYEKKVCGCAGTFLTGKYEVKSSVCCDDFVVTKLTKRGRTVMAGGRLIDLEIQKEISLGKGPAIMFMHRITDHSMEHAVFRCALEFNFMIWDRKVIKKPRRFSADRFSISDEYNGLNIEFLLNRKMDVFMYPIFSVNETEFGLRKTFQGISLYLMDTFGDIMDERKRDIKITLVTG